MKEKRVSLTGDIIPKQKPINDTPEPISEELPKKHKKQHDNPANKAQYDIVIHCATTALVQEYPPKIADMGEVCGACPFSNTPCRDGVLVPTETQLEDIKKILMMDEGTEETESGEDDVTQESPESGC